MKVALLSFHNAINYGAALQAYALEKYLLEQDIDCEYINYQNYHRRIAYNMSHHVWKSLKNKNFSMALKYFLGSPFMELRKIRFKSFYRKNLKCTKIVYKSSDEAKELNQLYDKFIVGSDQVWNFDNNGNDFAFLLNFVDDDSKKISYSSSFGMSEIPSLLNDKYSEYLSRINNISVRETYGIDLIKNLTGRDSKLVLDPVFLLSKQQWENLASQKKEKDNYVFFYTNRSNQVADFCRQTKYSFKNKKLYVLSRNVTFKDFLNRNRKVKYSMSPKEFIRIIRDSELVVSASFHCISLAIILNKPFVAILTGEKGKDERILNILNLLNLNNRILTSKMNEMDVCSTIDFIKVNHNIHKLVLDSTKFLKDSIKN